ncbi:1-deoxy-D-xylulose-5-phosphate reductoisomerase [Acetivibrio ethanolgignens]|uniref:1-deoxy-D-xylulose 5-phosphate reductoisomerase n=1 Tax=Acetivibrio ethanolgignens TaxID=290052 RepID=A0A0V8QJB8_9FIRM|nr:1-deoxy-D-xylulose-5-phosphate reductoisomerase [Acetivibrio ethanolgignens]KSV60661.1 1-deoxy-D-xylulose 5-phosphate reductoisomerase [Acetivibrio ethanolgignens]
MKRIVILGSTGSIGCQTLEVVREHREDFEITALAAGSSIDKLEVQAREFLPKLVCVWDSEKALELKKRLSDTGIGVVNGMEGMIACATEVSADIVVGAVVGMIGILPTIEAIKAGKDIALANKETLVTAGHIIMPLVKEKGVKLLPVDSEHSAIFQCLQGLHGEKEVERLILTASGGPFRGRKLSDLKDIQVEDALKHPNWAMGRKITIDSSTMVNKGLEVIEAKWLFDVDFDNIQVVLQPQSIIHSMVQFTDGAVMAQLGTPDMRLPIQYALYYPYRSPLSGDRLDFGSMGGITFEKPDMETFRGLSMAYEAGKAGGSVPTVYNAANERAVARFLNKEIGYLTIYEMIEYALNKHTRIENPTFEEILSIEKETYRLLDEKWN